MSHPGDRRMRGRGPAASAMGRAAAACRRAEGGPAATKDEILAFLAERVAKWWLPDDVLFVKELPHTATGKVLKRQLRQEHYDMYQSAAAEPGEVAAG